MKQSRATFLIFVLLIFNGEAKKRVCIIGAGRAGLAAIKTVAEQSDKFKTIAFERKSDVGGLWIYTDNVNTDEHGLPMQASVYKNLRINLPRQWMVYPNYPNFEVSNNSDDEASHEEFLEYMRNYTDHFQLRKYIQLNTLVTKVIPVKGNGDWKTTTWRVTLRNLNTNETHSSDCDAVMVCNGHYSKPRIPNIPGIEEYPGRVLHSYSYRKPEEFTNQTVVLLGAGISGIDIAKDLNKHAKLVYLSHNRPSNPFPINAPSNVQVVRGVVAVDRNKLILRDNSTIVADAFIFCTGYLYDFPFLDERSGIFVDHNKVHPLYNQEINLNNPTMAFIGLEDDAFFGGLCVGQAKYFLDLLQGKKSLTSNKDMWVENLI